MVMEQLKEEMHILHERYVKVTNYKPRTIGDIDKINSIRIRVAGILSKGINLAQNMAQIKRLNNIWTHGKEEI